MTDAQRAYHRAYYHLKIGPKTRNGRPAGRAARPAFDRAIERLVADASGCWIWTGFKNRGYGVIAGRNGTPTGVHRVVYEHFLGIIPDGLQIDHLCRNPACGNPTHMEAVTARVNTLRSNNSPAVNARKDKCLRGHDFTKENTYLWRGHRQCRACQTEGNRKLTAKRKAARHARGLRNTR